MSILFLEEVQFDQKNCSDFGLVTFVNHCTIKVSTVNKDFAKKEINFCSKELEVFSASLVLVPIDSTGP